MASNVPLLAAALALYAPSIAAAAVPQPRIFAPGVISTAAPDIAPAFVDGGRRLFFSRKQQGRWSVLQSDLRADAWSRPVVAGFSGHWNDLEAAAAPDSRYLVFASDRPGPGEKERLTAHYYGRDQVGGALWRVELAGNSMGTLRRLPHSVNAGSSVWTPSIAANDDLAFMRTDVGSGRFRLFFAKSDGNAGYVSVQPLSFSTGAANDVDPALDPGERFLIFSSDRDTPGDGGAPGAEHLFIALAPLSSRPVVCPLRFAGWSDAGISEVEPRLSPDGTRLYFASRHAAHAPGAAVSGPWDSGNANIWVVPFSTELWQAGGQVECGARAAPSPAFDEPRYRLAAIERGLIDQRSGTASNATVRRGCGLSNGMVPCQKYDGKSTSMPGDGRTEYSASSEGVVRMPGLPKESTPSSVRPSAMTSGSST